MGRTRRFQARILCATRLGLIASALLSLTLAWLSQSVVALWHGLGSISTTTLLLPVLGAFIPRLKMSPRGATAHMTLVLTLTSAWVILLNLKGAPPFGIEPIFVGLGLGILIWLIDRICFLRFSARH